MADQTSIFYQIGLKVKGSVAEASAGILSGGNTWTGTNDFEKAVTVAYADDTALDIKGTASTSDKLTAESLESTGDTDAKGGLNVTGDATISKNLTVEGNLTVSGTEAIVDADSLDVTDNIIKLSDGASGGAYAKDSGLYFERGSGNSASAFVFDESEESFVVGTLEGEVVPAGISTSKFSVAINGASATGITISPTNIQGQNSAWPTTGAWYDNTSGILFYLPKSGDTYNDMVAAAAAFTPHSSSQHFAGATITVTLIGDVGNNSPYTDYQGVSSTALSGFTAEVTSPPSNSNGDIANTTPAPLTVGSLKLDADELGNLNDFNAGYDA